MVGNGVLTSDDLAAALALQRRRDAPLGEILIANRFSTPREVQGALAAQINGEVLDISVAPPDPDLLARTNPDTCLALMAIPWRKVGSTTVIAASSAGKASLIRKTWPGRVSILRAHEQDIRRCIRDSFYPQMLDQAKHLCPDRFSCRRLGLGLAGWRGWLLLLGVALFIALAPSTAFLLVFFLALSGNVATTVLRGTALIAYLREKTVRPAPDATCLNDYRKRPVVSVLLPLFHETRVIDALITALSNSTYPKELLDAKILLEEGDIVTAKALDARRLPRWIEVITIPRDSLQTKPKAMNYALPYCRGKIIGIYDAEDRPDPDQIDLIVRHLQSAPRQVACVQAYLDFYNTSDNWLSRCFTIEYAVWFRVIMRGLSRLKIPLPLGGTSVFIRREVLDQVGAWDAHNVTEDADLGMRLARFGYRCEMVHSTTWEEANKRPVSWVKQRSRWLKGFAMTWASHMRAPRQLWHDLGPLGFLGFQTMLLGTALAFLLAPVFWLVWTGVLGVDWGFFALLPAWTWRATFALLIGGELVMFGVVLAAILAKRQPGLIPIYLTLPFYWPLGTIAAYKALSELFFRPFYWDKTDHGGQ